MKVSYKKMWVLCAEKEMSKAELRRRAGLSSATFTKLRTGGLVLCHIYKAEKESGSDDCCHAETCRRA